MKKLSTLFILILTALLTVTAQPPQAFKYKAIARDKNGHLMINKKVAMRISLLQDSENGMAVYVETHTPYSNLYGVIELEIGRGTPQTGTFELIDWGAGDYYVKVEMDTKNKPTKNYTVVGTSQLLSVPYALFAGHVQNSQDNDGDPMNELITNAYLSGSVLTILEGGNTTLIDLSGLQAGTGDDDDDPTNEIQNIEINDHDLTIVGGNTVTLPDNVDDADHDPENEIQVLSLIGNLLTLTSQGEPFQIDLAPYLDNSDNQNLVIDGHSLSIDHGNAVQLPDSVNDADHDPFNELQSLALNGTGLSISDRNTIDLAALQDGVIDDDADPTNELQLLRMSNDTIYLSEGGYVALPVANIVNGYFCYGDKDGDGYGDLYKALWIPANVPPPAGYISSSTDCDDNNTLIKPGVSDGCDGLDNDCDGTVDEDCAAPGCYEMVTEYLNCLDNYECQLNDGDCNGICISEAVDVLGCIDDACFYALIANPEEFSFDESWTTEAKANYIIQRCENPDGDGDGYPTYEGDCDDTDAGIHPGAVEICGDGIDQDCDGHDALCGDVDGDGFTVEMGDCNDGNAGVYPGAVDGCDGIDNNCNGTIDEDGMRSYFRDADADGYGDPGNSQMFCDDIEPGYVENSADCNDTDPGIHPGAEEICEDGIDQDCNGSDQPCSALTDDDGDGYSEVQGDCNDSDASIHPGATEICDDGIDQDCDGTPDDGCCHELLVEMFNCIDENGCLLSDQSCILSNCMVEIDAMTECLDNECVLDLLYNPELLPFDESWTNDARADYILSVCGSADADEDGYSPVEGDCNDDDPSIHPGASETCGDGIDQNCNGSDTSCDDADDDGYTIANGDCNDNDSMVYPGATELCDGKDNDCDDVVDEDTPVTTWYRDTDGDGYGNSEDQIESCLAPEGFVNNNLDCNDDDPTIYEDAPEICGDGIDQDCDGEDLVCPEDIDDDGDGFTENQGDCNDADTNIYPGATEIPDDGIDQNCDDSDEAPEDMDDDGDGFTENQGDCDDADASSHPGATEIQDAIDNNCDGIVDEGLIPEGAVIITEIMKDPDAVTENYGEWFEVTNVSSIKVNMQSFRILDNNTDDFVINKPSGIVLEPFETAVFCFSSDYALNGGVQCDYEWSNFQLNNTADEIILELNGIEINRVEYASWSDAPGHSLSLDPNAYDAVSNQDAANWCVSNTITANGDYGTPGDINPSCSGNLSVLMVYPSSGIEAGGETITITGSGFLGVTAVNIGEAICSSYTVIDDSRISCVTPAQTVGDYDVTVMNEVESGILGNGYRYTSIDSDILWGALIYPQTLSAFVGIATEAIFGRVYIDDIEGPPSGVIAQVGFGPPGTNPMTTPGWTWYLAEWTYSMYFPQDEFMRSLVFSTVGTYSYTYRFSVDGGYSFLYADFSPGTVDGFSPADLGTVIVQ